MPLIVRPGRIRASTPVSVEWSLMASTQGQCVTRLRRRSGPTRLAGSKLSAMDDLPLLPDQPSTSDHVRRFGPPVLLAIVALLFVVQNTESVKFNFLWFEFLWPLWIMLVVFMAVGAIVFWGVARRRRARKSRDD